MASLKAFKPGLKLLSKHRILSWNLAKETANKTTRNSIPSTKHSVEVDQHSSGTLDGYDCQVLVSIFSKTRKHLEMKHLIGKWIQHKLHKTAPLFTWHSICPWPSLLDRTLFSFDRNSAWAKGTTWAGKEFHQWEAVATMSTFPCSIDFNTPEYLSPNDFETNEFEIVTNCSTCYNSPNTLHSQYTLCRLNRKMSVIFNSRH